MVEASIIGDRETLKADSYIPLTMAIIYMLLFLYFKSIGGYRAVHIDGGIRLEALSLLELQNLTRKALTLPKFRYTFPPPSTGQRSGELGDRARCT